MLVKLKSQNHEIIDHGTVYLFNGNSDLTLNIIGDNSFEMSLIINFLYDSSGEQVINAEIIDNNIIVKCMNYRYDTIDGANRQTVYPRKMTQREAAIEAVKCIGLNQIKEVDEAIFENAMEWKDMFYKRLNVLKAAVTP